MPIYEYRCDGCGTEFEKLVRRSGGSDEVRCPSCGEKRLTPRLSTFAAHGSGTREQGSLPPCASGMCKNPELCGRN